MVVGLGVWRGFLWVGFCKGVFLGYSYGVFMGRENGCKIGLSDQFSLKIFKWTPSGLFGRVFGQEIGWWGFQVIRKYLGWLFSKIVSLSQTYGSKVIECGGWGDDGIGRQGGGGWSYISEPCMLAHFHWDFCSEGLDLLFNIYHKSY